MNPTYHLDVTIHQFRSRTDKHDQNINKVSVINMQKPPSEYDWASNVAVKLHSKISALLFCFPLNFLLWPCRQFLCRNELLREIVCENPSNRFRFGK